MCDLEREVAQWRAEQLSTTSLSIEAVEELEAHLRESVDRLVASGLTVDEALLVGKRRLGEPRALEGEFDKLSGSTSDRRLRWLLAGLVAAAVVPLGIHFVGRATALLGLAVGAPSEFVIAAAPLAGLVVLVPAALWVLRLPSRGGRVARFIEGGAGSKKDRRRAVIGGSGVVLVASLGNGAVVMGIARIAAASEFAYTAWGLQLLGWFVAFVVPIAAIVMLGCRRPAVHAS